MWSPQGEYSGIFKLNGELYTLQLLNNLIELTWNLAFRRKSQNKSVYLVQVTRLQKLDILIPIFRVLSVETATEATFFVSSA